MNNNKLMGNNTPKIDISIKQKEGSWFDLAKYEEKVIIDREIRQVKKDLKKQSEKYAKKELEK